MPWSRVEICNIDFWNKALIDEQMGMTKMLKHVTDAVHKKRYTYVYVWIFIHANIYVTYNSF